ncbi:phytanoyl-CoA dioxygenase family protein [Streptomyces sp. NPDC001508]|uniref:phytanoyl-CoA dioxygenase family protein n=1 Tax=Streptomyces sp. NPDC001508 TaxID=3154656 RepID=UPI00331C679E
MPKLLTDAQVHQYERDGYVHPLRAFSADEAQGILEHMDALERREPDLWSRAKYKPHLLMKWLNDFMRTPTVLDAVEDVLGPNVLAWGTAHFDKKPHDPKFVNWHQDSTYWGLSEPSVLTAWVALTPSRRTNGCLRVIPGSHRQGQVPHHDTFDKDSVLSRGQEVEVDVDENDAVDLELNPGEFSLHHTMLVHGSEANTSDIRRCGIAIRYVATRVRPIEGFRDSATLVRGVDEYGHFAPDVVPAYDMDPAAVAFYNDMREERERRRESIISRAGAGEGTGPDANPS